MVILGVCNANDSGSVLIVDGEIKCAVNEERFSRKKLTRAFPIKSIQYVLESNNLTVKDVDFIGCGAWNGIDRVATFPQLIEDIFQHLKYGAEDTQKYIFKRIKSSLKADQNSKLSIINELVKMGFNEDIVVFCDHHFSHALTAYCCSPFKKALVMTADGRGDFRSITLWKTDDSCELKLIDQVTELASPGAFYGFITKYLGFIPDWHEGKTTGLSALGKYSNAYNILKKGFYYDQSIQSIRSNIGEYYLPFLSAELPVLSELLEPFSKEDIAFAAQKILEEVLVSLLMKHIKNEKPDSVNICLAGGCFANVKLNYEIFSMVPIKNIYVFPHMGDGGNALGGALNIARNKTNKTHFSMQNVFLGPDYSDEQILAELKGHNLSFKKINSEEKADIISEKIANGEVVGWFQGKMEYGPRALGSRSILVEAKSLEITKQLNDRLQRTDFMPFAPVTIDTWAEKCFFDWKPDHIASRFMTVCYKCTPLLKEKCPAVVHCDNTARPQVVFKNDNPDYYNTIKLYINKTGNPAIINTSFNFHEKPIVMTPHDAIECYIKKYITVLILGNYLISQK